MSRSALIAGALTLALAATSATARAAGPPTECSGTFTGTAPGNLVVPAGEFCEIAGATIGGNVLVEPGALGLRADDATITGSVLAPGPIVSGVLLVHTTVGHDVRVAQTQAGSASGICVSTIGGNVILDRNAGLVIVGLDFPVCPFPTGNDIGGNLIATGNSGGLGISLNTVGKGVHVNSNSNFQEIVVNTIALTLECNNNTPPPFPFSAGNTAKTFVGQCQG